jgi:hypothetical protein
MYDLTHDTPARLPLEQLPDPADDAGRQAYFLDREAMARAYCRIHGIPADRRDRNGEANWFSVQTESDELLLAYHWERKRLLERATTSTPLPPPGTGR